MEEKQRERKKQNSQQEWRAEPLCFLRDKGISPLYTTLRRGRACCCTSVYPVLREAACAKAAGIAAHTCCCLGQATRLGNPRATQVECGRPTLGCPLCTSAIQWFKGFSCVDSTCEGIACPGAAAPATPTALGRGGFTAQPLAAPTAPWGRSFVAGFGCLLRLCGRCTGFRE